MLIEYCVVSATMVLVVWENSGVGYENSFQEDRMTSVSFSVEYAESGHDTNRDEDRLKLGNANSSSIGSMSIIDSGNNLSSVLAPVYELKSTKHYNSYRSFVMGWIHICVTSGITVLCLYDLYTGSQEAMVQDVSYGLNTVLSICCGITCFLTFFTLAKLTFEDQEAIETVRNEKGHDPVQYISEITHRMEHQLSIVTLLALTSWKIFTLLLP